MKIARLLDCYIAKLDASTEMRTSDYQRGQVLIISLLVLTVALTIGLSLVVRTITTTRMTSAEDNSKRAFSAAEAGLEQALTASAGTTITGNFASNNSSYSTSTTLLSGDEILADNGAFILKDQAVDVWLSSYPDYSTPWSGDLTIYWGASVDRCYASQADLSGPPNNMLPPYNSMAAIEVILISGTTANPSITHYAYDPCTTGRRTLNKFSAPTVGNTSVAGRNFYFRVTLPTITSGLLARVIPIYAGAYMGFRGVGSPPLGIGLPPQGTVITSTGNSGGTQRKIVSFRGYPKPPIELYPFLIFSPN